MKLKPFILPFLFLATAGLAQPTTRIIKYHSNDIVPIEARMRYTTLIQLPASEKIMEVATGDKDFWIIDAVGSYCFLHPAKDGLHSNLNLITDKGNVYSFTLDEDESVQPDLKVVIEPSDPSVIAEAIAAPKFVSASDITAARNQVQAAELHAKESVEKFRSEYPVKNLQFDYSYKNKKPFEIAAVYHDEQFTYIRTIAAEKFAVYELQDGKPNLINFQLKDDTYIIPKVLDRGYLQIGKHKLAFERKAR